MNLLQSLMVLVVIILVVWWALRRSAGESTKEAPAGHGHEEHEAHGEHVEHAGALPEDAAEAAPSPVSVVVTEPMPIPTAVVEIPSAPAVDSIPMPEPMPIPTPVVEIPTAPATDPIPLPEPIPPTLVEPASVVLPERFNEPVNVIEPQAEVHPDDLIIIEGIGPRISGILKGNGVRTFAQLAAMQPEEIQALLTSVDERLGRIADPSTWPEQAALAAKGDLEGLQKLQDSLKGGRTA